MSPSPDGLGLALEYYNSGNLQAAQQVCEQVLAADPRNADALHFLGVFALQAGRCEMAVDYIRQALGLRPNFPEAYSNLGTALKSLGRLREAVVSYRQAVQLKPDWAMAHNNLGVALEELGDDLAAEASWREAVRLQPSLADAHNNLGVILARRGAMDAAVESFRQAVAHQPSQVSGYLNLGLGLQNQGKLDEAAAQYEQALRVQGDCAAAYYSLGLLRSEQMRPQEALDCYRAAIRYKPDLADAHFSLGKLLRETGDLQGGIASYQRALELNPKDISTAGALVFALQHTCEWKNLQALTQRIIASVDNPAQDASSRPAAPFTCLTLSIATTPEQQLRCARQWIAKQPAPLIRFQHDRSTRRAAADGRITIGYASIDFREHPVAYLVVGLFENHDRRRFRTVGYSYGPDDGGPTRRRIAAAFDEFVDLQGSSSTDAARRMHADKVDILVDLGGYTRDARTQVMAMQPAPIQVSYWGYPATMAAPYMDYILVDPFIVPPDQQPFFSERLVHLPGCYMPCDSHRPISPETPRRRDCGLPEAGFVFGCFNSPYKITPAIFAVWMNLLHAVPDSALWLLEGNPLVPINLRRRAAEAGIDPRRLVFAPWTSAPEHLARYRLVDLALDCYPYSAHTTGSDALWVGCPLVTVVGETFASRVAGSLLQAIGLQDLVAGSFAEYAATALRLARDPASLAEVRQRLAANCTTCGLFDSERLARNVERAYEMMWQIYGAGEPPRSFAVA